MWSRQEWCSRKHDSWLTWRNPNSLVLVEGPEIAIQPVGTRSLLSTVSTPRPATRADLHGCPAKAYVAVGINRRADLPDPADLLEGVGKVHRHVKVRKVADQAS